MCYLIRLHAAFEIDPIENGFVTAFQTHRLHVRSVLFVLIGLANMLTIYLAYIMGFVLQSLCVLCIAIYIVNYMNLHFALRLIKYN